MDKISVVVPIYNVQDYVKACVESIRRQTYTNLEIILVDDGSTDKSNEICDEYAALDNRIKVIHKKNGGLSAARNAGLDICTGDYIGFVDGDDTIDEDMYELLYRNAVAYHADISMCKERLICGDKIYSRFRDTKVKIYHGFSDCIKELYLSCGLSISVCVKLYKKELFDNVRFLKGKTTEDGFIVCDLLKKNTKMAVQYISKYNYIKRQGSITHKRKYTNEILDLVEAYEKNHQKIISYSSQLLDISYYRLFWAYRETIYRIMMTDNCCDHEVEIRIIQNKIRKRLRLCAQNKFMSKKQKIATVISAYSSIWYKIIKRLIS